MDEILGLATTAEPPRPDHETQADHEQNGTEARVAPVAAHRRSMDDIHALSDEDDADENCKGADNAEYRAHHRGQTPGRTTIR